MTIKLRDYTFRILLPLLFSPILFIIIYSVNDIQLNGEKTDCYDRYGNKILGEECIVEGSFESKQSALLLMLLISTMLFFIVFFIGLSIDTLNSGWERI